MGWQWLGSAPGTCYKCQNGVWVQYGNCWGGGCPCCYLCISCWCTQPGITGSVGASHDNAPVGHDVIFALTTNPAGVCGNCITWSGGGEPATQEGGSEFITHWDTTGIKTVTAHCCGANFSKQVTIFKLDLIAEGVSEEQEEDPGKSILVNDDDDNNNGIADYADTGTVTGEDDLVEIDLSITPTLCSGSAMLEAFWDGDNCPIKIWLNPTKGTELTLQPGMEGTGYVSWNLWQETLPEKLYVEGRLAGGVVLVFSYNNVAWCDRVGFHVCDTYCYGTTCCPAGQKCCNGTCVDNCKIVNGESCSAADTFCSGCAMIGAGGCLWQGNAKICFGGSEKICNPRGCEGDCHDDTKICYTEYPCIPEEVGMPMATCSIFYPGMPPIPAPPHCNIGTIIDNCYFCTGDLNNPLNHWVQNDSCN